ncbi:MAG: TonB-dependent receptor plug domain-containing protein [Gemmatimonadota bacterium]|nr:TonB-dependent receptor plug domain-containing protein [Gemmatimonadota bacterium]
MRRSLFILVCAVLSSSASVTAQQPGDSSAFSELRPDGNGVAALRSATRAGFARVTAEVAIQEIAATAHLNVTYDPALTGLRTMISIRPSERTVAVALTEIGNASGLRMRVSRRGDIVIDAAPRAMAREQGTRPDSIARSVADLPGMRVEGARMERLDFEQAANSAAFKLPAEALRTVPSFVEPDVLRSVQLLPGVESRSDWSAGFNVHGGESDQSLILLDGYPIYSPFHLGGVFSTFISSSVGQVSLFTGALPARYGGRLSGVLDVGSALPTSAELHGSADISLLSTSTSLGRTFASGAGAWEFAARRTYADVVVNRFRNGGFPYHFQDFQLHAARQLGSDARISMTAYSGADVFGRDDVIQPTTGGWRNQVLGVTAERELRTAPRVFGMVLGDSASLVQQASLSRFNARLDARPDLVNGENDVLDVRAGGSVTMFRPSGTTSFGYDVAWQHFSYFAASPRETFSGLLPLDSLGQEARSVGLFADHSWRIHQKLLLDVGARLDAVQHVAGSGISPRVSVKYFLTPDVAISAGGGRYTQWVHSLGRQEEPVEPLQFWVMSDSARPASTVRDALVGVERWVTPNRLLHVGTFYKRYDDLLVPNENSDERTSGDSFTRSSGSSYGVDVLLRQLDGGDFSGWLAYAFSVSSRTDAQGYRYAPGQDRRHKLDLVGSWHRGDYTFGARVGVGSGLPTTPVIGSFVRATYDPGSGHWFTGGEPIQGISVAQNSDRLPMYKRVDVSVKRSTRLFGLAANPYVSVLNLSNAHNPAGYIYDFSGIPPKRTSFPNLPLVLTLGINVAF